MIRIYRRSRPLKQEQLSRHLALCCKIVSSASSFEILRVPSLVGRPTYPILSNRIYRLDSRRRLPGLQTASSSDHLIYYLRQS
jgi:hypothetical protein